MAKSFLIMVTIILGLSCFAASAGSFRQKQQQPQEVTLFYNIFKDWISTYNKQYGIEEMAVRFYNWRQNYDLVQQFNFENSEVKLEMNRFASLSAEEFSALHLGLNVNLKRQTSNNMKSTIEDDDDDSTNSTFNSSLLGAKQNKKNGLALPASVDWRTSGAVTGVKNQGKCGGCWSFSASGALEGLYAIKNKKLVSFSEQQMIDCSAQYGNQGCDGGLMTNAFQYTQDHGIQPEKGYEYAAKVDKCKQSAQKVAFKNNGFKEVAANNSLALKAAVARQPVSVGIEASSMTLQLFKSGVINTGCGTGLDHGVLIVGYDKTSTGQEYWIVKNSWGPEWGLQGFMHIAMGSQNEGAGACGINMMASYPTL